MPTESFLWWAVWYEICKQAFGGHTGTNKLTSFSHLCALHLLQQTLVL